MTGLRLEVDLAKVEDNTRQLVERLRLRNLTVTAVTKATLGFPDLARMLVNCGVQALGDSRIENVERMRSAGIEGPIQLLRSPIYSQVDRVVSAGVLTLNSETEVLSALAAEARGQGRIHNVMLMVELGDLREGVMPKNLSETVSHVLHLPNLHLCGIGANLACRNGIEPSATNMGQLSSLVNSTETTFDIEVEIVSGGNSANLNWAFDTNSVERVNNLRLGEAILLGREPLHRTPIAGLHTDAFLLVAEVIESKQKPTRPWGQRGENSSGEMAEWDDRGIIWQTILAVGRQDTEATDLTAPAGVTILAASSDHLIVQTRSRMKPGDEIGFEPGYSALLRSMTSPFVAKKKARPRQLNTNTTRVDIRDNAACVPPPGSTT